jgi:hypothetical protein
MHPECRRLRLKLAACMRTANTVVCVHADVPSALCSNACGQAASSDGAFGGSLRSSPLVPKLSLAAFGAVSDSPTAGTTGTLSTRMAATGRMLPVLRQPASAREALRSADNWRPDVLGDGGPVGFASRAAGHDSIPARQQQAPAAACSDPARQLYGRSRKSMGGAALRVAVAQVRAGRHDAGPASRAPEAT